MSMQALESRMLSLGTDQRPNDGQLIHPLSQQRHVFANFNSINVGMDRRKLTAILNGSQWLQVDHILMRRTTGEKNHDHRFV
jgi:hypothetical protein